MILQDYYDRVNEKIDSWSDEEFGEILIDAGIENCLDEVDYKMGIKQVIVIRKDLNMRKGKMCAQAAHASMKVFFDRAFSKKFLMQISLTPEMLKWINDKFTKIVVGVNSEFELLETYNQAVKTGIVCSLIQDCGLTEFNGIPTYTAVAIGPDYSEKIDLITGHLSLL